MSYRIRIVAKDWQARGKPVERRRLRTTYDSIRRRLREESDSVDYPDGVYDALYQEGSRIASKIYSKEPWKPRNSGEYWIPIKIVEITEGNKRRYEVWTYPLAR